MRVLVTGASGSIGSRLCAELRARGDEAVGLSRDPERARAVAPAVVWHAWRPAAERVAARALEGVDAVVNLVGESLDQRLTPAAKERLRASRVTATRNLVDGVLAADRVTPVLISQSAVGYYGGRGDEPVDESAGPGQDFAARLCVEWEAAALGAAEAGTRVVLVRSAPVLDPHAGLLKQLLLPFRLGVGGPLAGGRQYMPWIHRDDEVAILLWALDEATVEGPLNAAAPEQVTNREFSRALGRVLRRPALVPVPKLAIAALRGGELADAITESQRIVPARALDLGFRFRFPKLQPALSNLL